ncbi:MAG: hypothetical protein GY950_34355, partial [bacterium]|nr:hypothetical protein [bacterium]
NDMTREDFAALIGHYFERHLGTRSPLMITDIGTSFARVQIIKVCTLGIMNVRPDHSFGRYRIIDRAAFAVVVNRLLKYLEDEQGYSVSLASAGETGEAVEPRDISPLHKNYNIIKLMVNAQLLKLDSESCFNPTLKVTPTEALTAIRKILNSIEKM